MKTFVKGGLIGIVSTASGVFIGFLFGVSLVMSLFGLHGDPSSLQAGSIVALGVLLAAFLPGAIACAWPSRRPSIAGGALGAVAGLVGVATHVALIVSFGVSKSAAFAFALVVGGLAGALLFEAARARPASNGGRDVHRTTTR